MTEQKATLLQQWTYCMTGADWSYFVDSDKSTIVLFANGAVACLKIQMMVDEDTQRVVLLLPFEMLCPEKYRNTMAEYCCHVNSVISIGFMSVDMRDGEVRFRHSVDIEGTHPTPKFVDNFIKAAIGVGHRYYKAIHSIMFGYSLERAIAEEQNND